MLRRLSIQISIFKCHICLWRGTPTGRYRQIKEDLTWNFTPPADKYSVISHKLCVCTCIQFRPYLCAWHNRKEVKGRGPLGTIGIHGNRCCRVLDDCRGSDGRCLWGLFVASETVSTVDEFQVQHLCLELADGAKLCPPRHAICCSPHMALQWLEETQHQQRQTEWDGHREREHARVDCRRLSGPIRSCSGFSLLHTRCQHWAVC